MKLLLTFSRKGGGEPVIARTVKETGVLINVERAHIDSVSGEVLVDIPDADADIIRRHFENAGVNVELLEDAVRRDEEECIECGACISVCPQDVFSLDEDWHLRLEPERCVLCGKCVQACPHNALSILE
jgi:NAD-dependent dihydropyrimidine dehydrogenase PreA subunit